MTTDRRRRSTAIQPELPLRPHPSEVAKAAKALQAAKAAGAARVGRGARGRRADQVVNRRGAAQAAPASPSAPALPAAPGHPGDWRLDERTRRIGRQGVAAARAQLGDATTAGHSDESDKDRRRPGRAA
jgi:hypothetical protein